jgi:hypothetical protein
MNIQEEIQHYRNTERRHMIAAKDALQQGAPRLAGGNAHDVDFVLACVNYLDYIMSRFVQQGHANTARLRELVPADDADDQRILADIESTLDQTGKRLEVLRSASGQFQSGGTVPEEFQGACGEFLDFYNRVLARRKDPAQAIIQKHIDSDNYWQQTNDVSVESIETEQKLFKKIKQLSP